MALFLFLAMFSVMIPTAAAIAVERRGVADITDSSVNATMLQPQKNVMMLASLQSASMMARVSELSTRLPTNAAAATSTTAATSAATTVRTRLVDALTDGEQNATMQSKVDTRQNKMKIMIVGDSMTQGAQGDWTWRYRIWEWFVSQNVGVDLVGPYKGTKSPSAPGPPAPPYVEGDPLPTVSPPDTGGGYAVGVSPDFDSDHFAVWGRQMAQDEGLIQDVVGTYQPDYILVMLGFNDVGWSISDAAGTLQSTHNFVANARAAKPDIKFAMANIPMRAFIGGRKDLVIKTNTYNKLLAAAIPTWSTSQSLIELVHLRENYDCHTTGCPAGYDGLHPNSIGEYEIAQAFSITLVNSFQIGSQPLSIPLQVPTRPTPVPSNLQAVTSAEGVTVTWDAVYGAFGYDIRYRLVGFPEWNVGEIGTNRYDTVWTEDGLEWEYGVRTNNGNGSISDWSVTNSAVAHPQTAPGPVDIEANRALIFAADRLYVVFVVIFLLFLLAMLLFYCLFPQSIFKYIFGFG